MTATSLTTATRYFDSFEARELAFNQSVSHLIPCKYNGPYRFWFEFSQIVQHRLPKIDKQSTAYITCNPRDCLAFGTTGQVLTAARLAAMSINSDAGPSIHAIAAEFGLSHSINQPVRTLSGGEMVKLALAKTVTMISCSRRLSIASPFCWLAHQSIPLLEKVVSAYRTRGLPVSIYALEGEDDRNESPLTDPALWSIQGPQFMIQTRNARIILGKALTEIGGPLQTVAISDAQMQLASPCLIQGGNGQGKSLLAKSLSGTVGTRGDIFIGGSKGSSRLLFQDVITQTLLRSFKSLAQVGDGSEGNDVRKIFWIIWNHYHTIFGTVAPKIPVDFNVRTPNLLSIKILLVAARLWNLPKALILDEPDWGLTRRSAEALVLAVTRCAHDLSVPILIISHKPWWKKLVGSCLWVHKVPQTSNSDDSPRFTIGLDHSIEK